MDVIYGLIPLMIGLGLIGVVIFIWSVRSGQYDDLEGDANRILMDDDDPLLPQNQQKNRHDATARNNAEHNAENSQQSNPESNQKQ